MAASRSAPASRIPRWRRTGACASAIRCWPGRSSPARRAQIRNMATVGGNLLQRTRCAYFYDDAARAATSGTPGTGLRRDRRFQPHPRDPRRLGSLRRDASVRHVRGAGGARCHRASRRAAAARARLPLDDLHRLPGDTPEIETVLRAGRTDHRGRAAAVAFAARSTYRKVRDRASYAFALVSVAAALEVEDGRIKDVRLALGGVAHKPWRAVRPRRRLQRQPATRQLSARRPRRNSPTPWPLARQRVQDRTRKAHDHRRAWRTGRRTG